MSADALRRADDQFVGIREQVDTLAADLTSSLEFSDKERRIVGIDNLKRSSSVVGKINHRCNAHCSSSKLLTILFSHLSFFPLLIAVSLLCYDHVFPLNNCIHFPKSCSGPAITIYLFSHFCVTFWWIGMEFGVENSRGFVAEARTTTG